MRIAICDDNQNELQIINDHLKAYAEKHPSIQLSVISFSSAEAMVSRQPDKIDLFLLDVIMPGINGISLAKLLRNSGENAAVVFITSSRDFALEAYSVNALQYLLKPLSYDALSAVLDDVVLTLQKRKACSIVVSTREGYKNLYFHNIVFIECTRHLASFHLSDGSEVCTKTMRQSFASYVDPLLEDKRFMRTHHSFVINKDYVIKLNNKNFELFGGFTVPIAKDRLNEVKSEYLSYLDFQKENI